MLGWQVEQSAVSMAFTGDGAVNAWRGPRFGPSVALQYGPGAFPSRYGWDLPNPVSLSVPGADTRVPGLSVADEFNRPQDIRARPPAGEDPAVTAAKDRGYQASRELSGWKGFTRANASACPAGVMAADGLGLTSSKFWLGLAASVAVVAILGDLTKRKRF